MKKLLLSLMAVAVTSLAIADDKPINYSQVPQAIKTFVSKYFSRENVTAAMVDNEMFEQKEYTIHLSNGAKLEFRGNGNWQEIDCGTNPIPNGFFPAKIQQYVKKNYPDTKITKISLDKTNYEVKLSTGTEMEFTLAGDFMKMDD